MKVNIKTVDEKRTIVTRYVTKFALTEGIIDAMGELTESGNFYFGPNRWTFAPKGHHFATYEEAKEKAESMRKRKLDQLRQQSARLIALIF